MDFFFHFDKIKYSWNIHYFPSQKISIRKKKHFSLNNNAFICENRKQDHIEWEKKNNGKQQNIYILKKLSTKLSGIYQNFQKKKIRNFKNEEKKTIKNNGIFFFLNH